MKPFIYNLDFVKEQSKKELFNVVSLFAGGGGSSTGYRLAGGKVLAINEFIPAAQEAYAKNYPDTYIFKQDIRELTGEMILKQIGLKKGELDILDGSPPCASFSVAGLREKGWGREKKYSDTIQRADDLFYEFSRILKEVQPKVFIAENVKGITMGSAKNLLGSEQIDLFGDCDTTIYHTLVNCGYKVRYEVLNAKNYLVPQSRERTIFIGVRNDIDKKITYPKKLNEYITIKEAVEDLDIKEEEKIRPKCDTMKFKLWDYVNVGDSFQGAVKELYGKNGWFSRIKLDPNKVCNTITTKYEDYWHWSEKRNLTIKEVKRFTSLPDDYILSGNYQKDFERCGRMVPPLMMAAIAKHVYKTILL